MKNLSEKIFSTNIKISKKICVEDLIKLSVIRFNEKFKNGNLNRRLDYNYHNFKIKLVNSRYDEGFSIYFFIFLN